MKEFVFVLALVFSLNTVLSLTLEDVFDSDWEMFKKTYNKSYSTSSEESFRKKVYLENLNHINGHNLKTANGYKSYFLKMNEFGDMLHNEFVKQMNGFKNKLRLTNLNATTFLSPHNIQLPKKVDWRNEGYVTPVKNQGQCGSCWAFSTTGALEGQHFRKTGKLVSLSEQNLVDCSKKFGNHGCAGGFMDNAFAYIKKNHGIDTEKSYPYTAKDGKCHFSRRHIGATDSGFVDIEAGNETKLMEAVATVGPVSVAIDASHQSFQFYSHGVYDEEECSSDDLDHGVLVVGYGIEHGKDYWLVKNSWGTTWGQDGYIKMSRNKNNQCGISTESSYPLV